MRFKLLLAFLRPWKETNRQLKRIADAMDMYMRLEHNYHLTPPSAGERYEPASASYANDRESLIDELEVEAGHRRPFGEEGDE